MITDVIMVRWVAQRLCLDAEQAGILEGNSLCSGVGHLPGPTSVLGRCQR